MKTRKPYHAMLLALLLSVMIVKPAFACSWWNVICHITSPFGEAIQELTPELTANVNISHKIENVDELRGLVNTTAANLRSVTHVFGNETRLTIEKAEAELAEYTILLDSLAGRRIADLDARVQAKLLWIQQYTEQVSREIEQVIRVTSQEVQTVLGVTRQEAEALLRTSGEVAQETILTGGRVAQETIFVTSAEAQNVLHTGGRILQDSVHLAGEELRFSVLTASGEIKEIVTQISFETQSVIRTTSVELQEVIQHTTDGIDHLIHSTESSSLRVLEGTLFIVVRGADLTLAIGGAAAGLIFLFIAAYGWGRAILQEKLPEPGLTRKVVMGLMILTFLVALLPFGFLSKEARAYALLPMDKAKVYANVIGRAGETIPRVPQVSKFEPSTIIVRAGDPKQPTTLTVSGFNLMSGGHYPTARYHDQELRVTGTETELQIDLAAVIAYPQAADLLLLKFEEPTELLFKVDVQYAPVTATPSPTATPIATPTATADTSPHFIVQRGANLRSGPGTNYPVVGGAAAEERFAIVAKSGDSQWWQLCCSAGQSVWIFGQLGVAYNTATVPVATNIAPAPPPTSTPCPQPFTASFTASAERLKPGDEVTLRWAEVYHADSVAIFDGDRAIGVTFGGELKLVVRRTTNYQLAVGYCGGQQTFIGERLVTVE